MNESRTLTLLRHCSPESLMQAAMMIVVIKAVRARHEAGTLVSGDPLHDQSTIISVLDGKPQFPTERRPLSDETYVEPGGLDLRVFDQTERWIDRNGTHHQLDEMDHDYLVNVIGHMERHAATWWCQVAINELHQHSPVSVQALFDRGGRLIGEMTSHEWIRQTTLMNRLRELVDQTTTI